MKVLIVGGKGQVGSDLQTVLAGVHQVLAPGKDQLDLTEAASVSRVLREWRPDYVLNAAAFTKVDDCETRQDFAWKVNAEGPGILAGICRENGLPLLHLSTDYVFDGSKTPPTAYHEEDIPNPLSVYGKSKLEGERRVLTQANGAVVLRTAWVYGKVGSNFLKAILRKALQGQKLRVVNDQFGAPTWSWRIAQQIKKLMESGWTGLFHATAGGVTNWYEVAKTFLSFMEVKSELEACGSADYPLPARRPANSILQNRRLNEFELSVMRDWREDLGEFVARYRNALLQEAAEP